MTGVSGREEKQGVMIVSTAGRTGGSFAGSTHEKDVQVGKAAQATVCDWKPEGQHQSCKIREERVRDELGVRGQQCSSQVGGS